MELLEANKMYLEKSLKEFGIKKGEKAVNNTYMSNLIFKK